MMKRSLSLLTALVLAMALTIGCISPAAAKSEGCYIPGLEQAFRNWYYIPSTVPERYLAKGRNSISVELVLYDMEDSSKSEPAETAEVAFVSGDEHLKDALAVAEGSGCILSADLEKVTEPGSAVFEVISESQNYRSVEQITLRVLSWEDHPAITGAEDEPAVNLKQGTVISEDGLVGAIMENHIPEIADEFRNAGDKIDKTYRENGDIYPWISFPGTDTPYWYIETYSGQKDKAPQGDPDAPVFILIDPVGIASTSYEFAKVGSYPMEIAFGFGNFRAEFRANVNVLTYDISGPGSLAPGDTAQYALKDLGGGLLECAWSMEGEGAAVNEDNGEVTVNEDAETGSRLKLTAAPADGGIPVSLTITVARGILGAEEFKTLSILEGFSAPMLADELKYEIWQTHRNRWVAQVRADAPYMISESATVYELEEFFELDPEGMKAELADLSHEGMEDVAEEFLEIDGWTVWICTGRIPDSEEGDWYFGLVRAIRNNRMLSIQFSSYTDGGGDFAGLRPLTRDDMVKVAELIEYDPSQASITVEDGAITVSEKKETKVLSGGKKAQMTASFANPDRVNKKAKNDGIEWSVTDTATGEAPAEVTLDKNGNLTVKNTLAEVKNLEIKAYSPLFKTSGTYEITAIPAVKKIGTDPAELYFYVGTDTPQTVKVVLDPDTVPPMGITWTSQKKDFVEITDNGDGTASVKPLGTAGNGNIAVAEPSGKKANLKVSVVQPVTELELTVNGKQIPGGTVNVKEKLTPNNAGNKKVEWAIDAAEDVATINAKNGQVRIAKTAPVGTVITVTCTALGAPEPIVRTVQLEVVEK